MTPPGRSVLLVGATGLVGGECLRRLVADPGVREVRVLLRRPLPAALAHPKLVERVLDFERLDEHAQFFAVAQVVCALGTTIRSAGSQTAFRRVDHDYPIAVGRLARAAGARHYLLVSSVGADPAARGFYLRVKGETEQALLAQAWPAVTIARPSLLLGARTEFRLGERVAARLGFLMPGRFKPVRAARVAAALVRAAQEDRDGVRILENAELRATPA